MRDIAGEVGTCSLVMYSCGSLHVDEQRQDVQLEPTYTSSVAIRDVALRTCRKQWTIGRWGERGSEISVLIARYCDDDNGESPPPKKNITQLNTKLGISVIHIPTNFILLKSFLKINRDKHLFLKINSHKYVWFYYFSYVVFVIIFFLFIDFLS